MRTTGKLGQARQNDRLHTFSNIGSQVEHSDDGLRDSAAGCISWHEIRLVVTRNAPNQSLADALEETFRALGFRALNWFQLQSCQLGLWECELPETLTTTPSTPLTTLLANASAPAATP